MTKRKVQRERRRRRPTLGSRALRKVIRERELTLEQAADALDVPTFSVWRWVHGLVKPLHEQCCTIEDVFGVPHRAWLQRCTRVHDR